MATDVTLVAGESKILSYDVVDEDGAAVTVTGATCLWELSRYLGEEALLTYSTTDGSVVASGTTVEVTIDATDTEDLEGLYYHELTITDTQSNKSKTQGVLLVNAQVLAEQVTP